MQTNRPAGHRQGTVVRRAFCSALLASAASMALAATPDRHSHEKSAGGYTLRSSTVATSAVPAGSLAAQGIEQAPNRALLNVVLLRSGQKPRPTVRAVVDARVRTSSGASRAVDMKEVKANGRVSYTGVVDHQARETLEFQIRARPEGAQNAIELRYRDRMAP